MVTPLDAPTTDICQCTKANGADKSEGELGTTVICPDCHLEEENTREPDDVAQTAQPDESDVYLAFKGSVALMGIAESHPSDLSIKKAIKKRQRSQQSVRNLVDRYGMATLVISLKTLLDEEVFTSTDAARRRFPNLFSEDLAPGPEEGQETRTELPLVKESRPGGIDSNPFEDARGGLNIGELQNSRHCQISQDPQLPITLPIRPRQRLMSQLQLILEHACFSFGQRELQKELDKWGHSCAEAISLQTWVDLFKQDKMLETEDNAGSILDLLNNVAKVQNIVVLRISVNFDQVNQLLSSVEEFIRLLNIPVYRRAIEQLRESIGGILRTADQNAAAAQKEADRKLAHIEAQRKILEQQEEEVQRFLKENLGSIRDSIEHDVFTAMGQAKDALPDIGLADSR